MAYGRTLTAQSDQGKARAAYDYGEKGAGEYLDPHQRSAYENVMKEINTPMAVGMGFRRQIPEIGRREDLLKQMGRLRDVAGANALGDFESFASGFAKPHRAHASKGFLTEDLAGPASLPTPSAHPRHMSEKTDTGENWYQRYANLAGNVLDDKAFAGLGRRGDPRGGEAAAEAYGTDARVQLRDKFRNMRLGIDTPDIRSSGQGGMGFNRNAPKDDFLYDQDAKDRLFKAQSAYGATIGRAVKRGVTNEDRAAAQAAYDRVLGNLPDVLRYNPEDLYAGTWNPTGYS